MQKSIFTSIIMELCCSLMLILPIISYSQQGDGYYDNNFNISHFAPNVSYASPEATTLGKYVDIPVSLYTGVPSIIVPIYSIQASNLTIPINLSYHASGIKVEEVASWVGLGWSLNAGGIITREVRGLPLTRPRLSAAVTRMPTQLKTPKRYIEKRKPKIVTQK